MALPIVNELPKYEVTIPSTGKSTRFRPYLVKEEKALMMTFETGDEKVGLEAVVDTINSCLDDPIDRSLITTFDIEFLLLKIRSKSVGEKINLNVKCSECEHANEAAVVIDDIEVKKSDESNIIQLTDSISLEMKYPSYETVKEVDVNEQNTSALFKTLALCIDAVLTEEERVSTKDETVESMIEFIETLTSDQFLKITRFIQGTPKLSHDIEFKCIKCEKENKITVEGIQSFFT